VKANCVTRLVAACVRLCPVLVLLGGCISPASTTPVPSPTRTVAPTLAATTVPSRTPTPTHTSTPAHTPVPTATPSSIPAQTAAQAGVGAEDQEAWWRAKATSTPVPGPTPTPTPLPDRVYLEPMTHQWQTRDNCGPASIAIVLSYYGYEVTQHEVRDGLPSSPVAIQEYLYGYDLWTQQYGLRRRCNMLRMLLANGVPVIVGQRLSRERDIAHLRVIRGYDDVTHEFISDDPLLGPAVRISYEDMMWLSDADAVMYPVSSGEMYWRIRSWMVDPRINTLPG
jgi:hypothetical protein